MSNDNNDDMTIELLALADRHTELSKRIATLTAELEAVTLTGWEMVNDGKMPMDFLSINWAELERRANG